MRPGHYPESYSNAANINANAGPQSHPERTGNRVLELKSHTDDNDIVLGRNILEQIDSLIHLIRRP